MTEAKKTKKSEALNSKSEETMADTPVSVEGQSEVALNVEAQAEDAPAKPLAKAGKRSQKAIEEAEALQAKEERKAAKAQAEAEDKPKSTVKPPRSKVERKGKGYRTSAGKLEKGKLYGIAPALELAAQTSHVKFDASVELHIRLGVDPRHADQNIRDTIVLPAGTGKTVRVAVFADVDDASKAKNAGADIAGNEEFIDQLEKGTLNFDVLIATPSMMPKLGKFARVLGPKGLMPNPKSGTVTTDVEKAVTEAKAGRVEYRVDSTGIVHVAIGKVSFSQADLLKNAQALFASIKANKPASVKGTYVKSIFVTTSMGPSIHVDNNAL